MKIELLWFSECPNHVAAEVLVRDVMRELGIDEPITRIQVEDEATGMQTGFPGSPTIRVNGRDVEPGWEPCSECAPRCRLYPTEAGLRGVPERGWIRSALATAVGR